MDALRPTAPRKDPRPGAAALLWAWLARVWARLAVGEGTVKEGTADTAPLRRGRPDNRRERRRWRGPDPATGCTCGRDRRAPDGMVRSWVRRERGTVGNGACPAADCATGTAYVWGYRAAGEARVLHYSGVQQWRVGVAVALWTWWRRIGMLGLRLDDAVRSLTGDGVPEARACGPPGWEQPSEPLCASCPSRRLEESCALGSRAFGSRARPTTRRGP